jgi:3-methyladenine DNA glycosylase AlkD
VIKDAAKDAAQEVKEAVTPPKPEYALNPDAYWQPLLKSFVANTNAEDSKAMAQYMRHRFSFYGIDAVSKAFYAKHGTPPDDPLAGYLLHLWDQPERECQCVAVDLLRKRAPKLDAGAITLCETLITRKSWWNTVDHLAINVAGPLCQNHPALIDSHIQPWRS